MGRNITLEENETTRRTCGWIFTILGSVFIVLGIFFFIYINGINFYMEKASANILSVSEIVTVDGEHQSIVNVTFSVGEEIINTDFIYNGVFQSEQYNIDIWYDVRNPQNVYIVYWSFLPIPVIALGVVILIAGLIYLNVIGKNRKKLPKDASLKVKQEYMARQQIEGDIYICLAAVCFVIFGLICTFGFGNAWGWIFTIVGIVFIVYSLVCIFPELSKKKEPSKKAPKVKVVVVDDKIPGLDDVENTTETDSKSE